MRKIITILAFLLWTFSVQSQSKIISGTTVCVVIINDSAWIAADSKGSLVGEKDSEHEYTIERKVFKTRNIVYAAAGILAAYENDQQDTVFDVFAF